MVFYVCLLHCFSQRLFFLLQTFKIPYFFLTRDKISDFTDMEAKGSDLKHLVKDRARPPQKRRLPTRPSNRPAATKDPAQDENKEDEDIEVFWSKTVEE